MKYVVFGGTGYLGSHLVDQLISLGHQVVIFDNTSGKVVTEFESPVSIVKGEITKAEDLHKLDQFNDIDGAFHLAAKKSVPESLLNPDLYEQVNQIGTSNVIDYCLTRGINKFIYSSSAAVYGNIDSNEVITEDFLCNPINPYGSSKLSGELLLSKVTETANLSALSLRIFNIVGAEHAKYFDFAGENVLPIIMRKMLDEQEFMVYGNAYNTHDGTCVRDYVNIRDVANAHIDAMNYLFSIPNVNGHKVVNISSGMGFSILDLINKINTLSKSELKWRFGENRAGDPASVIGSNNLAFQLLGWAPSIDLDQGIKETIAAFNL